MTDLTKVYIDIRKCSEVQLNYIFSITKIREEYIDYTPYLYLNNGTWGLSNGCYIMRNNSTELLYPEFIKLFEDGEGENELEHTCKYCGCLTTQPDSECYAKPKNTMETPINRMTLDDAKEQVVKQFTEGKHTWYSGYLNNSIKSILMNDVAELYATQFKMEIAQLQADKVELLEALEGVKPALRYFPEMKKQIESLIQKNKP